MKKVIGMAFAAALSLSVQDQQTLVPPGQTILRAHVDDVIRIVWLNDGRELMP